MNEPIKIIHKYKNNNRKIQYNILIFIGNILNEQTNKILLKIKDKDLYNSLTELNEKEINILINEYGEYWYKYFFITKHINHTFEKIIKPNKDKIKEIINKYGQLWYNNHIDNYMNISKTIYSYQSKFKENIKNKLHIQKLKLKDIDNETFKLDTNDIKQQNMNFLIDKKDINSFDLPTKRYKIDNNNKTNILDLSTYNNNDDDDDDIDLDNIENEIEENKFDINYDVDKFDINELDNIIKVDTIYDKNPDMINESLQELIDKTDLEIKSDIYSQITKWNNVNDSHMYDNELINIYKKTYIYNQYICIDDTIKKIKNKICCGYEKSKHFDKNSQYFLPSRIYLWSEYSYLDNSDILKTDKIMLGQKWIRTYELLDIDIEPNDNIRNYEILKGNLKNLQESIYKYGSKIIFENDEQYILSDYSDYIINNEIYMLDIYNELGINYQNTEEYIKNLYDVYIKIYFTGIPYEELKNIINYLNSNKILECTKITTTYKNMQNDLIIENEILKIVEELKKSKNLYSKYFKENYITQSVIHINLKHKNYYNIPTVDLYRIFDNFIIDNKYPFIQYQTLDSKIIFKYYSLNIDYDKNAILSKWFENAPYGISFKVNIEDDINNKKDLLKTNKYISINFNENGRIEYKTTWKEDDNATIDNVKASYIEIKKLLKKINSENDKLKLEIPTDDKFKFAFINTILQFELPEKYMISHNDLSDFSRNFFPYIAVVVEPKRRQSKILKKQDKSKYGTYLRYKRISKYENDINIEKKILYFLKNYEFNEKLLTIEISKQFNITEKDALNQILYVIDKYPYIKKVRNVLKTFDNIPKYKLPGIGIEIQGKLKNKYKMRITGARSNEQLDEIILFMNILIYLYIETYLYKKPERQELKNKLKLLTNVAKRRNKVEEFTEYKEDIKSIKQITKLDKERLAYKPEKGQNQWSRNCQNSGDDKVRRPEPYTNIDQIIKLGYELNSNTGDYERIIKLKNGKTTTLKAAKITNLDNPENEIYYTCNPEINGEYMYIGFLSRSANPYGLCMPCCYKKNSALSKNKEKRNYHLNCLGKHTSEVKSKKILTDKLYILQDSFKIQPNRYSNLPFYLDIYLNNMLKNTKLIKNNYLISSNGWLFKYGVKQDDDIFLSVISNALDISIQDIKNKISTILSEQDNKESIFASLNNGNIKSQFSNIESYIRYLYTNYEIEFDLIADILSIPGILNDYGLNIIIFDNIIKSNKNNIVNEDFNILCVNPENLNYFKNNNKINIILLKEEYNYYPIYQLNKGNTKFININKTFKYENDNSNIINHIYKFLKLNYKQDIINELNIHNAKLTFYYIEKYNLSKYYPTAQIIDKNNKCKYFIFNDEYIFPIKPSGVLFWIPLISIENYDKYITTIDIISDILYDIYLNTEKNINCLPIGVMYSKKENNDYFIDSLIINQHISLPIKQTIMSKNDIIEYAKKYKIKNIYTQSKTLYDYIDKELINYEIDKKIIIDKRISNVNYDKYLNEGYELFKLELSNFLKTNIELKNKIIKIIDSRQINNEKKYKIKNILYKLIDKKLYDIFKNIKFDDANDDEPITDDISTFTIEETNDYLDDSDLNILSETDIIGGSNDNLITIDDAIPELNNYTTGNTRNVCPINDNKDICNMNQHCSWKANSCLFKSTNIQIIQYINKITEELINNNLKSNEILNRDNYFILDIINKDYYTTRNNQKIIKSNNYNLKRLLSELFGANNIPIIGRRKIIKTTNNFNDLNIMYSLEIIGNRMYQIIYNQNYIFRAFTNSYFWLNNTLLDINHRNLGYYNPLQTELANYFKSLVIDWITNKNNQQKILDDLHPILNFNKLSFINEFKQYLIKSEKIFYSYIVDLYILNQITNYIIILFNNFDNVMCVFDNCIKIINNNNDDINYEYYNTINIKFHINNLSESDYINTISSIYFITQ